MSKKLLQNHEKLLQLKLDNELPVNLSDVITGALTETKMIIEQLKESRQANTSLIKIIRHMAAGIINSTFKISDAQKLLEDCDYLPAEKEQNNLEV